MLVVSVCLTHSYYHLKGSSLIELANGCSKLKTLILFNCNEVTDADIATLFTYCTQLTCLHIRNCQRFSGKCLETSGTATLRRLFIQDNFVVR